VGESGIELAVPLYVAAEPGGNVLGDDLEEAAERVELVGGGIDRRDHRRLGVAVDASDRRAISVVADRGEGNLSVNVEAGAADLHDVAGHLDVEVGEELLAEPTGRHAAGRFAGAGALQDVPQVCAVVLEPAGQVGVSGAWPGHLAGIPFRCRLVAAFTDGAAAGVAVGGGIGGRIGPHDVLPVGPILVLDQIGDGAAQSLAVADAADDANAVGLDLHPLATAVATHATDQIRVDRVDIDGQTGGQSLEDAHQHGAVRFAGRHQTQDAKGHGAAVYQGPSGL